MIYQMERKESSWMPEADIQRSSFPESREFTGDKPPECNERGKAFRSNSQLTVHHRIRIGDIFTNVRSVRKLFSTTQNLFIIKEFIKDRNLMNVVKCGQAFRSKGYHTEYQKIHAGDFLYECKECGKGFLNNSGLTQHQKIHSEEKPYECCECMEAFRSKTLLSVHQRIHTGEMLYKCKVCGEAFLYNSELIRHQRVHTGEEPYECCECGKAFRIKTQLTLHQKIHIGDILFEWKECGKDFPYNSGLI
ncbi:uncharacterized protein LOC110203978 [Phascolarctos cinereus]|uniref:Zinc finger protein 565-like n=1 Tax=Phascolarctos cinereus TaxID=38626 RepID=A0A6P5JP17_PHACI|nr:zinc finger protein 565-like [Phascolarctos cinereus]XP_020836023.1 zinc finger protein 565-like [Phascolarctos cinereus]XP_020836024.1 zinc finger protein 565-like [Phascolarctos cinereus]XP_020836026.1 zinc finger protein 565-like [Phascolarctos cinereus]XP_020836027.1 zinc finger protein 565-like [Phascolarctos cinereus]